MKNLKNLLRIGKKRTDRLLLCGVLGEINILQRVKEGIDYDNS